MAKHEVIATDAEIDDAIASAKRLTEERRAVSVGYRSDPWLDVFVIRMQDGERLFIPREKLQGMRHATRKQLSHIELLENGTGLRWLDLDVDFSVSGLLLHVYGTKRWMEGFGRAEAFALPAKRKASQAKDRLSGHSGSLARAAAGA